MTAIIQTAIEWARENGTPFTFRVALDNHEPPRLVRKGRAWYFHGHPRVFDGVIVEDASEFPEGDKANYLIDNGYAVEAFYVAGWHQGQDYLILHPFPLSFGLRPDNGRPVDMSTWMRGPRRAYHLKIQPRGKRAA